LRARQEPDFDNLALRVRLAASHADVSTVALVAVDGERDLTELARELEQAMPSAPPVLAAETAAIAPDKRNGNGDAPGGTGTAAATLVMDKLAVRSPVLGFCTIAQMQRRADTSRVGILVLSGPVARAARISALNDLALSSGWPILGVVGVPRLRRRAGALASGRQMLTGRLASGAAGSHSEGSAE
jgi:hypothetical protein